MYKKAFWLAECNTHGILNRIQKNYEKTSTGQKVCSGTTSLSIKLPHTRCTQNRERGPQPLPTLPEDKVVGIDGRKTNEVLLLWQKVPALLSQEVTNTSYPV